VEHDQLALQCERQLRMTEPCSLMYAVGSSQHGDRERARRKFALRQMSRRHFATVIASALLFTLAAACDETPELPPQKPRAPASQPTIGAECIMTLHADRTVTLGQLVLVLQRDPLAADSLAFSLTTFHPGPDGSKMILGTFAHADSIAGLTKSEIRLTSTSFLNLSGNGIFTPTAAYQPKSVDLQVTSIDETHAQGTFSGQFYHFSMARPSTRPEVIEAKGKFTAALIIK
jgi:hypothetical protein